MPCVPTLALQLTSACANHAAHTVLPFPTVGTLRMPAERKKSEQAGHAPTTERAHLEEGRPLLLLLLLERQRERESRRPGPGVRRPRPEAFVGQGQDSSANAKIRRPEYLRHKAWGHMRARQERRPNGPAASGHMSALRPPSLMEIRQGKPENLQRDRSTWCLGNPLQAIWRAKGACRRSPRARGNKWVIDTPPALNPSRGSFTPAPTANKNQRRHPRTNPDAPPPARQRDSRQPEDAEAREADDVDLCKDVRLSNRSKMQLPIRAMAMCIEGTQVQTRPPSGERTGSGDEARGRGWGCGFDCAAFG